MPLNIAKIYKIPVLIALTLVVILSSLIVVKDPVQVALILTGSILGVFLLDLDYLLHAYFFDTDTEFAQNLKVYIRDKDYKNALLYMYSSKQLVSEKTLNSVLFQVCLAVLAYFIISSHGNLFLQAFILSAYVNSIYRYAEIYYNHEDPNQWFWIIKDKPTPQGLKMYGLALIGILLFLLGMF